MGILSNIKIMLANSLNYGIRRLIGKIEYIVIHFTANDGDTDENNGRYFANNVVKASAHYFVDSNSITRSVPDDYIAFSVGGKKYSDCAKTGGGKFYKKCTNANSISIELCDDKKNGIIYPSDKTIENALKLTKSLMEKYKVPKDKVIRHFDVTGKKCPVYWCEDAKWKAEFWDKLSDAVEVYKEPNTNLRLGSRGEGVKWMQSYLVKWGYTIAVDGIFGKNTQAALMAFQKSAGIDVDGICGKMTRKRLKE